MKRNWIRTIIKGLSFTSVMFVFQACYGTPQDYGLDILVEGQVKSKTSGLPLKGIKVSESHNLQHEITDENGKFSFYTEFRDSLSFQFQNVDSVQNSQYADKDTLLTGIADSRLFLAIMMEEK